MIVNMQQQQQANSGVLWRRWKPLILITLLQVGLAGMDILSKAALNQGMSNYVLVVYCHAFATLVFSPFALFFDRKMRPKMTWPIFFKIMVLGLLEPVIDQNLYFLGMKYTTATFAAAIVNMLPAITFLMACLVGLEKIRVKSVHSQAKVVGTIATVAGAMVMILIKGPVVELFWIKGRRYQGQGGISSGGGVDLHSFIKGSLMIMAGSFSCAAFVILQAITMETYPAELSLTALICLMGAIEGSIVAVVMERGNSPQVWALHWDTKLLATAYNGVVCAGLTYYIQGVVMKERGPVFVTAFSPLCMIMVAVLSSVIFAEQMFLGRVVGAAVIVAGLYLVIWGKTKDDDTISLPPLTVKANTNEQAISTTQMTLNVSHGDGGSNCGHPQHHHGVTIEAAASSSDAVPAQDETSTNHASHNLPDV